MHQPACQNGSTNNVLSSQGGQQPHFVLFHVPMWVAGRAGAPVCHVAWAGAAASSHALEIPAALAHCLGLSDGALVGLRALPEVPLATSVSVEPANADDWEQVELNAEYMEEQLLNQVLREFHNAPLPHDQTYGDHELQTIKHWALGPTEGSCVASGKVSCLVQKHAPTNKWQTVGFSVDEERTSNSGLGGRHQCVTHAAELAHAGGSCQRGAALPVLGARPVGAHIAGGHGAAGAGGTTGAGC